MHHSPDPSRALGVLAPIVTPCSRSGEPDLDGLRCVCDDMLQAGADAVFVLGSTGRGPWFGLNAGRAVCRAAADHLGPAVPLFAGCMDSGLPRMLERAQAMADSGAQFAVATAPGYFNYSQREIESVFLKFADASRLPVMIYDIPAFTGTKLDMECVLRLARHENVIGFKDSSEDIERFRILTEALADRRQLWLLQGKENLLLESLQAGASGFVVSLLHILPRPFVELYRAVRDADPGKATALQNRVNDLFRLVVGCVKRGPESSTLFHIINGALRRRKVCENVLLEHEGDAPDWLEEAAAKAIQILSD